MCSKLNSSEKSIRLVGGQLERQHLKKDKDILVGGMNVRVGILEGAFCRGN